MQPQNKKGTKKFSSTWKQVNLSFLQQLGCSQLGIPLLLTEQRRCICQGTPSAIVGHRRLDIQKTNFSTVQKEWNTKIKHQPCS